MNISIEILYRDDYIVVINKPSGLLSVPFEGYKGKTAVDILESLLRKEGLWKKNYRPYAVHRLDKDTSGVMMFALNEKAQNIISNTWHTMVTSRKYIAVGENPNSLKRDNVFGKLKGDSGVIDAPLAQNQYHQSYVPLSLVDKRGKKITTQEARTNYKILLKGKKYTMFELQLDTGKKNQIRAHLAYCGYPLAGDLNYRGKTNPFNRLALHAETLAFVHPFTKEELSFEVKAPANWIKIVQG